MAPTSSILRAQGEVRGVWPGPGAGACRRTRGRMLAETVTPRGKKIKGDPTQGTTLPSLPPTITKKESHQAQTIAAHAAKGAALQDAQNMADILLDAEMRPGGMLAEIERKPAFESSREGTIEKGKSMIRGSVPTLPPGLTKKESHQAQTIARNHQTVERVKERVRVEGKNPGKTAPFSSSTSTQPSLYYPDFSLPGWK